MTNDALTAEQIKELKKLLTLQTNTIESKTEDLKQAAEPVKLDQSSVGRVSRIDAIQQQQMAQQSLRQQTNHLKQLKYAYKKILSNEYGYCEDCENPIAFQRLSIQPTAQLCIQCQTKREG